MLQRLKPVASGDAPALKRAGIGVAMRQKGIGAAAPAAAVSAGSGADSERIEQLEQMVNQLRDEVATLKARLDGISPEEEEHGLA